MLSNAYVTGFGASKRVVILRQCAPENGSAGSTFIFGHEAGTTSSNHIRNGLSFFRRGPAISLFCALLDLARWEVSSKVYGRRMGVLCCSTAHTGRILFLSSPIVNGYTRMQEHNADVFGLELITASFPIHRRWPLTLSGHGRNRSRRSQFRSIYYLLDVFSPPLAERLVFAHTTIHGQKSVAEYIKPEEAAA